MAGINDFRAGHFFTRWLQRLGPTRFPYVVDERSHDGVWIELGRYTSKAEARAGFDHMVANGRDPARMRVAKRALPQS